MQIMGLHNISCNVDIMKLNFLHKLFNLPSHCLSKQLFIKSSPHDRNAVHLGYITDICKRLYVVNNFFHNPCSIPLKTTWKRIVKRTVLEYETRLWKHRLINDTDFTFFQFLQTSIQPSIVYIMCKQC